MKPEKRLLGSAQDSLRRHPRLYQGLVAALGPVRVSRAFRQRKNSLLSSCGQKSVIINIGSGPYDIARRDGIINLDLTPFANVDVVASATDLPFGADTADLIVNVALLEHVEDPAKAVAEMHRVLGPGGTVLCYVPFMQPFHSSPSDFFRWTLPGLRRLFSDFTVIEAGIGAGPASGFLWTLEEWLSLFFSMGSKSGHDVLFGLFSLLLSPVKLLDVFMERLPFAEILASGFYVVAEKAK